MCQPLPDGVDAGIQAIRASGLHLRLVKGRLKVEPPEQITPDMDLWLLDHSGEVKRLLAAEQAPALPVPNTTPTPDVFFDELAPRLNEGELRVMLYLIRRTYGWGKEEDRVSLGQFCRGIKHRDGTRVDHGTGMARTSVVRALQSLEARGLVIAEKGEDERHGHAVTKYRLNLMRV